MPIREECWFAVHDALPAYWMVGPCSYDPGRGIWSVTARSDVHGRGHFPVTVSGLGADELAALFDVHARLTGMPRPAEDAAKRERLKRRLRLAFYQGAQEESRATTGRPLDDETLARVLARFPDRRRPSAGLLP